MGIAQLVSQAREVSDDGLAVAENALENGFGSIGGRTLQSRAGPSK